MDESQLNPQNKNAQALLSRWNSGIFRIRTLCYDSPCPDVAGNPFVDIHTLWRRRLWLVDLFRQYLKGTDLIFYPGGHKADTLGMECRRIIGKQIPVISTIEGLIGNKEREKEYSEWAGHDVYCQHVPEEGLERWDTIFTESKRIIAISPFLAEMGKWRYGDKFCILPLGIDTSVFYPSSKLQQGRVEVVSAGRVEAHKRPELFLRLAEQYPEADFIWYGEGSLTESLTDEAVKRGLNNISFRGSKTPNQLAEAFRNANIFVLPSLSEGVPKVTQEAAACGLPVILFGHYESPSVVDGQNGFVVWDDESFIKNIGALLDDPVLMGSFGKAGVEISKEWGWDVIAPRWENLIVKLLGVNK